MIAKGESANNWDFLFVSIVGGMSPGEAKKTMELWEWKYFCFKTRGGKLSLNVKFRSYGGMTKMGRNTCTGMRVEELF